MEKKKLTASAGDDVKEDVVQRFPPEKDNLLKILHFLQDHHPRHYLPEENLRWVADYLGMTLASVYGAVTYYTMLSTTPRGKYLVRLCESAVCHLKEAQRLLADLKEFLGVKVGETTADGLFTLELSQCLGHCENAPVFMINETIYGSLTKEKIKAVLAAKK